MPEDETESPAGIAPLALLPDLAGYPPASRSFAMLNIGPVKELIELALLATILALAFL